MKDKRKNPKNKVKEWFDKTNGNTTDLKIECSEFTGLTYRTIHEAYSKPEKLFSLATLTAIAQFLSTKHDKVITIDDLLINGKSELELSAAKAFVPKS